MQQFHHYGYVSEDPRVEHPAGVGLDRPDELPDEIDVLIIGTGPTGIITAAQLAQFPSITTRVIEKRAGRLELGHADGVSTRSVETFAAFGFEREIVDECYRITQAAFWGPDPEDPDSIIRTSVVEDDPNGLSEFWHITVNQARVADYFIDFMKKSPARNKPDYGWEFVHLEVKDGEYPVEVQLRRSAGEDVGREKTVRAKYVLGADGARSAVRANIGRTLVGTTSMHAWGCIDGLVTTDFPDFRSKAIIQSGNGGSILWIPREGGYLTRIYVDLGEVTEENAETIRATPLQSVIDQGNAILHPYKMEVKDVPWHSIYEVGHRVTDKFDEVPNELTGTRTPRVFIGGDACHTHSAKAGQGMNVSMQDGWNLGWKLGYVLDGRSPETLLDTYSAERLQIAEDLVNFDRTWSTIMAKHPDELTDPNERETFYTGTWEFPSGMATKYPQALLVGADTYQDLAAGFPVGKRFKSSAVMRVCDANPKQLGHLHRADGRWRIYVFADGAAAGEDSATAKLASWLETSSDSPLAYQPKDGDQDAWFDVKVIYQRPAAEVEMAKVPKVFRPVVGPFKLDNWEQVFAADPKDDIFNAREISRSGAVVVVRPDQYVAGVFPLDKPEELAAFFAPVLKRN